MKESFNIFENNRTDGTYDNDILKKYQDIARNNEKLEKCIPKLFSLLNSYPDQTIYEERSLIKACIKFSCNLNIQEQTI